MAGKSGEGSPGAGGHRAPPGGVRASNLHTLRDLLIDVGFVSPRPPPGDRIWQHLWDPIIRKAAGVVRAWAVEQGVRVVRCRECRPATRVLGSGIHFEHREGAICAGYLSPLGRHVHVRVFFGRVGMIRQPFFYAQIYDVDFPDEP